MHSHWVFGSLPCQNDEFPEDIMAWQKTVSSQKFLCRAFCELSDRHMRAELTPFLGLQRREHWETVGTNFVEFHQCRLLARLQKNNSVPKMAESLKIEANLVNFR